MSSLNTLQELTRDAARYRWARENAEELLAWLTGEHYDRRGKIDEYIDKELERDE